MQTVHRQLTRYSIQYVTYTTKLCRWGAETLRADINFTTQILPVLFNLYRKNKTPYHTMYNCIKFKVVAFFFLYEKPSTSKVKLKRQTCRVISSMVRYDDTNLYEAISISDLEFFTFILHRQTERPVMGNYKF